MQRSTLDLLQATTELRPLDASALIKAGADHAFLLAALQKAELPPLPPWN